LHPNTQTQKVGRPILSNISFQKAQNPPLCRGVCPVCRALSIRLSNLKSMGMTGTAEGKQEDRSWKADLQLTRQK
jgi:hypothetical protein